MAERDTAVMCSVSAGEYCFPLFSFIDMTAGSQLLLIYGGRKATGVLPGLQNLCGADDTSRVGSIPTCPRQKNDYENTKKE